MIALNIEQFISAVREADTFDLPDMTEGERYLYSNLYGRLSRNKEVHLSELDFAAFELHDIEFLRELHSELESHECKSEAIAHSLRGLFPVAVSAAFV